MSVQNNYNNYIKRQKQNSIGNFRDKIKNSLSGVKNDSSIINTPKATVNSLNARTTNTPKTTLGVTSTPKTNTNKTTTPKTPLSAYTSHPKLYSMNEHIINPLSTQNTVQPLSAPQNTTSAPATNVTPQTQPVTEQSTQIETPVEGAVEGLMSADEINEAFNQPQARTLSQEDAQAINTLANDAQVQIQAYSSGKTPQQMAQELLEMQKAQLQKDWEMKKQELELQKNQAQQSHEQSVKDAENTYNQSVEKLNDARYQQKEELAVSAQKRGIQYSPQQLGLENVANINHNKNLAEASKTRNELLNNLSIELGKVMGNITLGLQNATNSYNSSLTSLMADYQKQMMDWEYNDQQTEADRKWQEEQTKKDQAFQKEMAELQNKWQAEQNALDRATYGKTRSGGSGYSYSRSYYPRSSYSRGYRSAYGNWGNYSLGGYSNDLDLSTETGSEAFGNTVEEYSTDLYNALDVGGLYDVNDRGKIYIDEIDQYLDYAKQNGASKAVIDELERTRKYAVKNLFDKSYARSTNTAVQVGDTVYKSTTPLSKHYINKNKATKQLNRAKYESVVARTEKEKKQAKTNESFFKSTGQGRTLNDLHEFAKKKAQSNKSTSKSTKTDKKTAKAPYKPISKQTTAQAKNTAKKTVQSSTMSKLNTIKKNTTTSKSSTKKKVTKTSTKSKFKKSLSNLKKNIKKLFKW